MTNPPHTNHLPWADQVARIRGLAETHELDDIAAMLRISLPEVRRALDGTPRAKWWVRNNKTCETRQCYGERGAYRIACLLGWTDWDCGRAEAVAA